MAFDQAPQFQRGLSAFRTELGRLEKDLCENREAPGAGPTFCHGVGLVRSFGRRRAASGLADGASARIEGVFKGRFRILK